MVEERNKFGSFRVPFSAYDIFVYLIPGFTILICILLFEFISIKRLGTSFYTPLYSFLIITYHSDLLKSWGFSVLYLFLFLNFAYVAGHIITSASSLLIDRILISKGHGYPYEELVKIPNPTRSRYSAPFYRGLFFLANICLLLLCLNWFTPSFHKFIFVFLKFLYWFLIIIAIIKILGGWIRHSKGGLYKIFTSGKLKFITITITFFIIRIFPAFYDSLYKLFSNYLRTNVSFDDDFINKYRSYFGNNFSMTPERSQTNNFWLSYCYVIDRSNVFNALLVYWLQMCNFARNLSMSFYLAFLYSLVSLSLQSSTFHICLYPVIRFVPFGFFALFLVMLIRYYYLYYCHLSKFAFRSFVYLNTRNSKEGARIDKSLKNDEEEIQILGFE